jgi:hypothetical protein
MTNQMINKIVCCWSKVRRAFLVYLAPSVTNKKLARRMGECRRCGACCELMFICPSLDRSNGAPVCRKYDTRSKVCKLFPLDKFDLSDRDRVNSKQKCGFYFTT